MSDKYPSLPFESSHITMIRRSIQKKRSKEEFLAFYIFRPFSIYISLFIYKKTKISANSLTLLMAVYSLLIPFILKWVDGYNHVALLTFYFSILYMLDVIDGEVARLRNKNSKFGYMLDICLWFSIPMNYMCVIYELSSGMKFSTYIFYLNSVAVCLHLYVSQLPMIVGDLNKEGSSNLLLDVVKFPFTMFGFLLVGYPFLYIFSNCNIDYVFVYIILVPLLYMANSAKNFIVLTRDLVD